MWVVSKNLRCHSEDNKEANMRTLTQLVLKREKKKERKYYDNCCRVFFVMRYMQEGIFFSHALHEVSKSFSCVKKKRKKRLECCSYNYCPSANIALVTIFGFLIHHYHKVPASVTFGGSLHHSPSWTPESNLTWRGLYRGQRFFFCLVDTVCATKYAVLPDVGGVG